MNDYLNKLIDKKALNQRDVAIIAGIPYQELNMFMTGKRRIPLKKSLILDKVLDLPQGTIARKQLENDIVNETKNMKYYDIKKKLIEAIKDNGGFWSYNSPPYELDDDSIIEAALIHLPFEKMDLLEGCWSKSKIKKVWKQRLLTQGKRMNILNFLLALKIFNIKEPQKYISRWA